MVYDRITSPIPCAPENRTDRWAAYNDYKAASLKGNTPPQGGGEPPICSETDLKVDENPECWVLAPGEHCNPHITWRDLHDQRDEVFQQVRGAEVQGVYLSSPTGEISTTLRLAKGTRKTYSCTTAITRNRYAGNEEWGQWEQISNCSFVTINGVEAVELRIERRALSIRDVVAPHQVTLLTKWPSSRKREFQAFFNSVSPTVDNSSTLRTQRSLPVYTPPSDTERAGGCPHKTTEKWFRWTVGITKPGKKIKPYPPGLQWIGKQSLAGRRTLYFVETPVLSSDQVHKIEGTWGSDVLDTLLDCIAIKLDPLDRPWRNLDKDQFAKRVARNSGEMIPICREPAYLGGRWTTPKKFDYATVGAEASCRVKYRNLLRRFRVSGSAPHWENEYPVYKWSKDEQKRWNSRPRTRWENYAGLGLTHYEVQLLDSCWAKPGTSEEDKLRMFIHQQLAAQILGFQLYTGRRLPYKSHPTAPFPGGFVVAIGENNREPPAEQTPDPNVNPDGADKPLRDWVWDWKKQRAQMPFTHFDQKNYLKGEISLPPPLILTKKTESGYILRWGMEPTFQATGAQLGAYPGTTYGVRGKHLCTPEDQSECTTRETQPSRHVDEATSAMVDLASTRTLTHVTDGSGQSVVWINWGSLTREQAEEIGCDPKRMVDRYYIWRNPPPQDHAWNNMHWYDTPVVRDKNDRWRWFAITGDPGSWFYNPAYPNEVGGPTILLDCYRESPVSPLGPLQSSLTYRGTTNKCGSLYSLSAEWMEKGFPYVWSPEAYLLNRWSFTNTQYCNNNGQGNCGCHSTCGQEGWLGSVMMPSTCDASAYDYGTPWPSPSNYLVTGSSLTPGVGWTARGFTLQAVFPKTHAVNMTDGGCTPQEKHSKPVKRDNSGWTRFKLLNSLVTKTIGYAANDLGESIKSDVTKVYDVATSVIQTSWKVVSGILKWAVPCLMLLCLCILISVLHHLGLLGTVGRTLKATARWFWSLTNPAQREEPRLRERV